MASSSGLNVETAASRVRSGIALPPNAVRSSIRLVVEAADFSSDELNPLADDFMEIQLHYPFVKPIFLISAMDPRSLAEAGFLFETAMTRAAWSNLQASASYEEYVERRVSEMIAVYSAERAGRLAPGARVPRWFYER